MKKINEILKRNSLRALSYKKIGKVMVIKTKSGNFVIKETNENKEIFNYLITRNFKYYPDIIDYDGKYEITKYIKNIEIPKEQKINDLIKLVDVLHLKTTYYKELNNSEYKKLYEDIKNNIEYLKEYYNDLIFIKTPETL